MVAARPVDFRGGVDGLAVLVPRAFSGYSGVVYVPGAKRSDRIKLVSWDGKGLCFFAGDWRMTSSAGRRSTTVRSDGVGAAR